MSPVVRRAGVSNKVLSLALLHPAASSWNVTLHAPLFKSASSLPVMFAVTRYLLCFVTPPRMPVVSQRLGIWAPWEVLSASVISASPELL